VRRLLLVLILTAAGLFGPWVPPASACSCATYDVRERLPEVDGAFVGRLIAKEEPTPVDGVFSSATLARYRFSVEQPVKGDIPSPTIDVWASTSGASCGLETPVGERVGLLLDRDGDRWTSSLCGQVDPDVLIRAGQPLPPPNGVPPPAVLVGTTHGPGRMLSLDGRGRIVAFGDGAGNVSDLAFCRGNRLVAEAFSSPNEHSYHNPGVAIRRTADLTVVWERSIATGSERSMSVSDVGCREKSDAGEVLAIAVEQYSTDTTVHHEVRVLLIGPDGAPRELWRGEATGGTFAADGTAAYLSAGPDGRQLLHLDLADPAHPAARILAELPPEAGAMALSPDGRHLATVTTFRPYSSDESPPPIKAVVVDLGAAPPTVNEVQLATGSGAPYSPLWAGAERVAFVLAWGGEPVRVFDTALREVASWSGWSASTSAVVGDHLVGMTGGMVVTAPLLTGPQAQWADLESGLPGAIVAFPGGAAIGAPAEPPSTTTTTAAPNPQPTGEHAVASLPADGGSGSGGRLLLVGGAGAALLAAATAGLVRRRRLPKLPPL
jgi:hypothetical protein